MLTTQVRDVIKKATQLHTVDLNSPNLAELLEENSALIAKLKDLNYSYTWNSKPKLDKVIIRRCLELVKINMMDLYNETNYCGGWNERSKIQVMSVNSNFYFIILDKDCLVGFLCYRFITIQDCQPITPVCYIFEIQLRDDSRGLGIGRLLINLTKKVTLRYKLSKVMCTCIKINSRALDFYYKCGFSPDPSDPDTYYDSINSQDRKEVVYKILKL